MQRRRTQIRLAQRAYRQRKDTAITTLEKRVKELERANDDISRDFNDFFGILVSERVLERAPQAIQRLSSIGKKITATADRVKYGTLNGYSSPSDEDSAEVANASESGAQYPRMPASSAQRITPSSAQGTIHQGVSFQEARYSETYGDPITAPAVAASSLASTSASTSTSYSAPLIDVPSHPVSYGITTAAAPHGADFPVYSSMESRAVADFDATMASAPSPYQALPAPSSFAANEHTFGRRLQRHSTERGFRLLTSWSPSPERFAAVFGFCLLFETKDEIIRRFQKTLNCSPHEDLCFWKYPFTNLGGAGTFLPGHPPITTTSPDKASGNSGASRSSSSMPVGNQGTQSYGKPQTMTGMSVGPWGPAVQATRDEKIHCGPDRRLQMVLAGFEGDFFDSDEVETHLRRLGIFIPQRTDFVHADIDLNELEEHEKTVQVNNGSGLQSQQVLYGRPSSGMYATSRNSSRTSADGVVESSYSAGNSFVAKYGGIAQGSQSFPGSASESAPPSISGNANGFGTAAPAHISPRSGNRAWPQPVTWPNKVRVTLDVVALLAELSNKTVCLGRSPGVRRKDVNAAVKVAAGLMTSSR
ncbi:hypothetical protein E4U60_004606 [Claviceps pazoutovae]|uniref:BZIP domain-containing protein n=1 Tax=Claviceps pazoutovae TaxID=1649127 RepID=A0A9P7M8U4_9HYPO|nr:hypothetical protein E4U60_004606 [Claviceps pazoutovae]